MSPYTDYLSELDQLTSRIVDGQCDRDTQRAVDTALSDGPMAALRKARPIEELRSDGTFFTGPEIAKQLWASALDEINESSLVVDPAVGVGDLLLPPARRMHARGIESWPSKFVGLDIDTHFVAATKSRLRLATDPSLPDSLFTRVRVHDFFSSTAPELAVASHVVMNPPYVQSTIQGDPRWAGKTVNTAAVFVERSIATMRPGARLIALLPDVLRSGSRYSMWRDEVASMCETLTVEELGQFDAKTDIHVFILNAVKGHEGMPASTWPKADNWNGQTVGDYFDVHVGAVVPHRHSDAGAPVPFASAGEIERWAEIATIDARRGFSGRLDRGPLVLVRRTSRPGDRHRAQASLYTGTKPLAVENHLLVLTPREGGLDFCRKLMDVLKSGATTEHLDRAIRLRHLTVTAVSSIPWGQK